MLVQRDNRKDTAMRLSLAIALSLVLAACQKSEKDQLQEAANQSDPAAAAVLNNAAENGMDPQDALQQAGEAAAANGTEPSSSSNGM